MFKHGKKCKNGDGDITPQTKTPKLSWTGVKIGAGVLCFFAECFLEFSTM
jgi:hypothetical protein